MSAPYYGQPMPHAQYSGPSSTTVVVQQPMGRGAPRMWSTGVTDCCDDMGICLCGWCCPICLACQVATDMGESACVPCCVPAATMAMRIKWRTQENIEGSIMDDCLIVCCCDPCALCQLGREVKRKREGTLQ